MTNKIIWIILLIWLGNIHHAVQAQRNFVHPGITYTKGDLDRMKVMVAAKQEPYYSTFLKLKESPYSSLAAPVIDRGEQIKEGRFNATIGVDGRRAHDLALLWHLTGDEAYARKAVEYLNANSHYTNTSSRGTGALDNGKIYLLIDAAELMRDYPGWDAKEQQCFKDMLVYPGYSHTEDLFAKYANYWDDSKNGVTFYWNIYNFDAARFGNQGLFAARGMMAMGIYLDNEVMYDRAYRYLLGMEHRQDDLPYPSGPAISSEDPVRTSPYMIDYKLLGRKTDIPDYGYDEQLQHYIYPNGQIQESSRDQGHVLAGVHNYVAIAEMAWNQGDSLYSCLNNRILLGLEWNYRYNLSSVQAYEDQQTSWEPVGFTKNVDEVTFENGKYLRIKSRSGRWESVNVSPHGRGDAAGSGGAREMALAHYAVRAGLPVEKYTWLERYRDYMIEHHGCENWGVAPNWFYEWTGWGTLAKRLTPWMAGEPVTFGSGERVSGIHALPGTIQAADYDYYCLSENPEGHTYHNIGTERGNEYRPDGAVELEKVSNEYVVTHCEDGEWMNYTVEVPLSGDYTIYAVYRSEGKSLLSIASDQGTDTGTNRLPASKGWREAEIGRLSLSAGACVIRLRIDKAGRELALRKIIVR
ncbi:alginate lyase family protein [Bacteroides congonensis]|uniref:alginate lyase family protein n=1 Tax=Bacteroides congonensis TaxID=1871006 RepID=UPI000932FCB6|nr:alginate lyase family protein [Bacteroides congonensis]